MKGSFKCVLVSINVLNFVCTNSVSAIRLYEKNNTDMYLNSLQIIRKYGYPAESHVTRTPDGYLLSLHRIPHGKKSKSVTVGPPVFLQHGAMGSSADFLLTGPDKSLPFLLADRGYDVWLGNIRGNTYSRAHESLTPEDNKFWNFSWHESGLYDISTQIDYICNYTRRDELTYLGFSMGTTEFFVLASTRPEYQRKIRGAVLFAAVAYLKNTRTLIRYLAPLANNIQVLSEFFTDGEFVQQSTLYRYLVRLACTLNTIEKDLCTNIIFMYTGCDPFQFNEVDEPTLFSTIAYHIPAGSSVKTFTHYAQLIQSGEFRQFDYGPQENMIRYNSPQPPSYNVEDIHTPLYIFEGANDFLSTEKDVSRLVERLPNVRNVTIVDYPLFTHLDFLFAKDVKKLLYDKAIQAIDDLADEVPIGPEDDYDD